MKTLITFILVSFAALSGIAQTTSTITITFRGINRGTNNYQVMIDGSSYYSNNSQNIPNYKVALNNVQVGTHTLKIYKLKNNDPAYNSNSQNTLVYSKNFELRQRYDMNIVILPTGVVQFSEQPSNDQSTVNRLSDYQFNTLLKSVQNRRTQALKGQTIRDAFMNTSNYFSTAQIRQLLSLITAENNRLDLAKLSYRSVTDPANFIQLSDLFYSSTYRNEFNNYVAANGGQIDNNIKAQMADYQFSQLLQSVRDQWSQSLKGEKIRSAFVNTGNYFSTAQIRQLVSSITSESNRLDLVKLSFRNVTDPGNFTQLSDLFYSSAYRNEFNNYVRLNGGQTTNNTVKTQMTNYEFNQLIQSVRDKWSQSLKAEAERDAFINTSNYFSTAQIRQLLTLVTSESDRLDLAKLSYRSVTDAVNFAQLGDMFNNTYRSEFNNYVRVQQGGQIINETVITPMADSDFNVLVLSIRSNLLQILKVSAERDVFNNPNNYFTVSQVKQLISLINSESNRLELAKLAYRTVTDRGNFTQLNDLFKLQASRDDLANYVKAYQI